MINGALPRLAAALAVVGVVSVSCGELTRPEAYAPTTSSSVVDGVEQETASQVQERPGIVGVDELVPNQAGYVPTLLVSGTQFILGVDEVEVGADTQTVELSSTPLVGSLSDLRTTRAVDDLGGGLVVQEAEGPIVYLQAQGEPEPLANPGDTLLDIGYWEGSPRAFVEVGSGQVDWIQLVSEQPGAAHERQIHLQLAEDEEIVGFSASRDIQAVIVQDDQCGQLRFFGANGQALELQGPVVPECVFPGRPTFGAVALSPDSDAVAYTVVSYRSDGTEAATELLAQELIAGSEAYFTRRIGEDLDAVTSLTFDGERAAYLKDSGDIQTVTVLDLGAETERPVDLLGLSDIYSVSFARIPVAPVG